MAQDINVPDTNHSEALHDNGMYVFMGEVTQDSISPIVEWIL